MLKLLTVTGMSTPTVRDPPATAARPLTVVLPIFVGGGTTVLQEGTEMIAVTIMKKEMGCPLLIVKVLHIPGSSYRRSPALRKDAVRKEYLSAVC